MEDVAKGTKTTWRKTVPKPNAQIVKRTILHFQELAKYTKGRGKSWRYRRNFNISGSKEIVDSYIKDNT